ncbi:MAG: hypothetical protein DDT36_01770 [Firmicutes bacterium]|nr:hypothetical protein [candidate division NPL-UPA2 bacterium]MBT9158751.1 hypothetical protein [Bacillota bacterium]
MARVALGVQPVVPTGMWPVLTAAITAGHMFANTERGIFIFVRNAHTAPVTVTIPSTLNRDGLLLAARVVTVPNGTDRLIGPVLGENHNQLTGVDVGNTYIDYSVVTAVSVAVLRV